MKRNITLHIITPAAISMLLFAGTFAFVVMPFIEEQLVAKKRETLRDVATSVWSILDQYYNDAKYGQMTMAEAQHKAMSIIRNIRYGPEGKDYIWINDMTPKMLMHPYRDELEGSNVKDFKDPDGHYLFRDFVKTVQKKGEGYVDYVWQWQDDTGRVSSKVSFVKGFEPWGWVIGTGIYVEDVKYAIRNITRRLVYFFLAIITILIGLSFYIVVQGVRLETERHLAEVGRIHSERRLSDIISFLPDATFVVNRDRKIIAWNRAMEQMTGLRETEILGKDSTMYTPVFFSHRRKLLIDLIFTPENIAEYARTYIRFQQEGQTVAGEIFAPRLGREGKYLYSVACPLYDENNVIVGAIESMRDITERVKIQERLIHSEKMLSIGGLAAGMAHEINNPLAGIIHNAELVQMRITKNSAKNRKVAHEAGVSFDDILGYSEKRGIPSLIKNVMSSARRAAQIVDNMLGFARKSETVKQTVDISTLLDDTLELAKTNFNIKKRFDFRKINIIKEYAPLLPHVSCESAKIQQVFLNILQNAAYAMTQHNSTLQQLTLRTENENDRYIRVEIEDTGPGIPEELQQRVFEPFFTTKEVGDGTGLGLSISYFIITENHNGTLDVRSGKDGGSNFILRLPLD
ncbi:MAG: cache domain-containing protein [Deltaproteobacteria bacterium]|nr:cache domain-containing protein [Deltaproteobacteria bacterium]